MDALALLVAALPFAAAMANLIALGVVYFGARDRVLARGLLPLGVTAALWNLGLALRYLPAAPQSHPWLLQCLPLPLFFVAAAAYQAAVVWCGAGGMFARAVIAAGYAWAGALAALQLKGHVISGFLVQSWGVTGRAGPMYFLFVIQLVLLFGLCVAVAATAGRTATDPTVRLRAKYCIAGLLLGPPLAVTNILGNHGHAVVPLASLGNGLFLFLLAYAIARHRLLEIDAIAMRVAGFLFTALLIVVTLAVAALFMQQRAFGGVNPRATALFVTGTAIAVLVVVQVRSLFQGGAATAVLPVQAATPDGAVSFSREAVKLPAPTELGRQLLSSVRVGLDLASVALFLPRDEDGVFTPVFVEGRPVEHLEVSAAEARVLCDAAGDGFVVNARRAASSRPEVERLQMWETWVPLRVRGDCVGFVALCSKREQLVLDDVAGAILTVLNAQSAIALQNGEYLRRIEEQEREIEALHEELERENTCVREELLGQLEATGLIGASGPFRQALLDIAHAANSKSSVLLQGETGTGKELAARAIHELSDRRGWPMIAIHCAAIPFELVESELFGCERGAFTDARGPRPGRFESANRGTVFLDEVGEIPPHVQVKLLRVLEEREIQRLGGNEVRKLDIRVIAASNRDMRSLLRPGRLREDLYYRLAGFVIRLPPLRERHDDIVLLATHFLDNFGASKGIRGFSPDALARLRAHHWPGNVRELRNVVSQAVALCDGHVIQARHLRGIPEKAELEEAESARSLREALKAEKRRRVIEALEQAQGVQAAAARALGMSRSNFARLLRSLGVSKEMVSLYRPRRRM